MDKKKKNQILGYWTLKHIFPTVVESFFVPIQGTLKKLGEDRNSTTEVRREGENKYI